MSCLVSSCLVLVLFCLVVFFAILFASSCVIFAGSHLTRPPNLVWFLSSLFYSIMVYPRSPRTQTVHHSEQKSSCFARTCCALGHILSMLCCVVLSCLVLCCGVVWCGVVWCGVVWCGVMWCSVVLCCAMLCCTSCLVLPRVDTNVSLKM